MTDIVTTNETTLATMPGEFSPVGWQPPSDLTREEWLAMGPRLGGVAKALHFWIGDWLNEGERKWGEMYAQAMSDTDFGYYTLTRDVWVCKSIPREIRRPELFFTHHWHVAALDAEKQSEMLDKAVEEEWSSGRLKEEVQKLTPQPDETEQPPLIVKPLSEYLEKLDSNTTTPIYAVSADDELVVVGFTGESKVSDGKFEPSKWCAECRETAERQYKYQMGWKRYAHRLEQRVAELEKKEEIEYEPNAPLVPINWKEELAKI